MEKDKERLAVIENIKKCLVENNLNSKVEIGDPNVDKMLLEEKTNNFDIFKKNPINKIKNKIVRKIINNFVNEFNQDTEIVGLENIENIDTGAIITSNHFSPKDSTPIIYAIKKVGMYKKFNIVIDDNNLAMDGLFGFIMNYFNTVPINSDKEYNEKKFMPAIEKLLKNNNLILIYPEEEMWFNYKKVRNLKIGAYHLAAKFEVPIIPCFVEMREKSGEYEEDGFNKLKFVLHIMPPIYPNKDKSLKENKIMMHDKDYELKKEAYEKAYGKEMSYEFSDEDIAGYKEKSKEKVLIKK